jgi:predicted ATPase
MSFIESFEIVTDRVNPWPYNVPAIKYCGNIDLDSELTFIIGDNGTGKSTLLETLGYRLQLPLINGMIAGESMDAAIKLQSYLSIRWNIERMRGFFFRAEDFGKYVTSGEGAQNNLGTALEELKGKVPDAVINQMQENNDFALAEMRRIYGQKLTTFSHGEAYLKIMHERVDREGIYLLDEPEAALSPSRLLSLIYFIKEHLQKFRSQFIIATHSPMLMAIPGAKIYEVSEEGMTQVSLEETEHYTITKSFLNDPELYLRHLK